MREKKWDREVLFAKFELHLRLALINKEAVFVKLELRLRLVLANLRQRPRLWLELRFWLALAYKLSASENGFVSDSSFAFSLLSSRNFQPQRTVLLVA